MENLLNFIMLNLRIGPNCQIDVICVSYTQEPLFVFENAQGSNKSIAGWWFKLTIAEETGSTAISNGKKNVELDKECNPQKSHVAGGIALNFTITQQPQLRLQLQVTFAFSRKQVNGKSAEKNSSVSSKSSQKNVRRQISNSLIENLRQTAGASPPIVASSSNKNSTLILLEEARMPKQSTGNLKPRRQYTSTELGSTEKLSFQVISSLQRQSFIHTFAARYTENMKQLEVIYDACSTILDSDALHKLLKVVDIFSEKKETAVLNLLNAADKTQNKFVVRLANRGQLNHASLPNCSLVDAAITIDCAIMFDSCFHLVSEFHQILERERRANEPSEFLDVLLSFVDQIEEQLKLEQKVETKVAELQTVWCAAMEKAKVNRRLTIPLSINAVPSHASLVQQPPLYAELKCAMAKRSNSIISKASPLKRPKYAVNEHADLLHNVRRNLRPVKSTQKESRPVARIAANVESLD
ncbi:hypothetical protein M3Y94_00859000 [Aphelenchoides besseyi]|nr:hypothetical protein M3Y94_00859000 [Aphelenchoides besseyi]